MRIVSWNVARRSSRLAEQAAALSRREPEVVALQEVTERTLPLWRAALEMIGLAHVRASLDGADPARVPAARRRTGVLLSSRTPLANASAALPVPWPETAIAAVASAEATGPVELHCAHVPNAANGWVKVRTLEAIRGGLADEQWAEVDDPARRYLDTWRADRLSEAKATPTATGDCRTPYAIMK